MDTTHTHTHMLTHTRTYTLVRTGTHTTLTYVLHEWHTYAADGPDYGHVDIDTQTLFTVVKPSDCPLSITAISISQ